jgi:hypothetical protein
MSIPCRRLSPIAMMFALVALVVAGCGSDETTSPPTATPTDEAPPLAPTGVGVASQFVTKFQIDWNDNVEPDLLGYRVYLYDPSPLRADAFIPLVQGDPLPTSEMVLAGERGTTYTFRVSAIDVSGNESAWSEPFVFQFNAGTGFEDAELGGPDSETPVYGSPEHEWQGPRLPNDHGHTPDRK